MSTFKWGILAPGTIAHRFCQGLAVIDDAAAHAVGSRDLGRAQAFASQYGIPRAYGSYEELARDPEVDAIYVATPHPFHEPAVILCLEQGKAVLCEKPFAANRAQAERMVALARQNGLFLMEAMWTRFLPAIRKAVELIDGGAIGRVRHVTADFAFRAEVNPDSRLFAPAMAGGALLDVGIYNLAFCSMIYKQQPEQILSHLHIGSTGVDEAAAVQMHYPQGASAQVYAGIRVNTAHEAMVYGEKGFIRIPDYWHANRLYLHTSEEPQEFHLPFEASGFQFEAMEVMACVRAGRRESPLMPLDETLALAGTMDEIRRAGNLRYPFEEA